MTSRACRSASRPRPSLCDASATLDALLLDAQLRLARTHRCLTLLELGESLEPGCELRFARREGRRRLGDLHLARCDRRLALLDACEPLARDAQLCLAPLELGLRLADRSFAPVELAQLRKPGFELCLAARELALRLRQRRLALCDVGGLLLELAPPFRRAPPRPP